MNSDSPKVTVYIANHNYEKYVGQAIDSVLSQTFADFELIVIDDGSADGSAEIMRLYESHPKVQLIFQSQKGLNVTNNIAFRAARGEYFMRLDADDILAPEALAVLSSTLDRDPRVGLVFPDYYHIDERGEIIELVRRHDFEKVGLLDQPAHGACTMIRRSCLEMIGGYNEAYNCQDGVDIWLRLIEHYQIKNVNVPLFYYRRHGANLTSQEARLLDTRSEIFAKRARERAANRHSVCVVPVRGKAIDPRSVELEHLGGRPLIEWTIDAALEAGNVDRVLVTSPDAEVLAHVSSRYPGERVRIIRRSADLAGINTNLSGAVLDAIAQDAETSGDRRAIDYVVTLLVESPFRTSKEIDAAIDVLTIFDVDTVVSVRPELDVFYQHHGDGLVPVRRNPGLRLEREELFREAGQIYGARMSFLKNSGSIVGGRIGHLGIKEASALRVSSELSWKLARSIAAETPAGLGASATRISSAGPSVAIR